MTVPQNPVDAAVARVRLIARARAELEAVAPTEIVELPELDARLAHAESRFARLSALFGLDRRECDLIQTCFAVALDPGLGTVFALIQGAPARTYVTEPLLARMFDHGPRRVMTTESPLRRWGLIHESQVAAGEPPALELDPVIRDWLVGGAELDGCLLDVARLHEPRNALPRWPVDETAELVHRHIRGDTAGPRRCRVRVVGITGSGRRTFAACVAARLELPLIVVDADRISDEQWPTIYIRAQRQAYLDGSALAWIGEAAVRRAWPDSLASFPVQFWIGELGADGPSPVRDIVDHGITLPVPSFAERRALWLSQVPAASGWNVEELDRLATAHAVTVGEITDVAARGVETIDGAATAVREMSRHRLGELARWVECPFTWDDLIVPESLRAALSELVFEARDRGTFWEQPAARRLFPHGRGLFGLFTGSPGTGKTMAAQVIAASLGLDLFRISLSSVVSKYVGETAKNLALILARAETMDAVLLFDEADALFAKRTDVRDAQDRFANTDTNYLLQAIEAYRGIALLATNKKANIDAAFTRRLRYVLDFPRPDAGSRRLMWQRFVGELAGEDRARAVAGSIDRLASSVEVTGAQIKYAVLAALFTGRQHARPLGYADLLHGLDRELTKEGRALDERERRRLSDA